MTLLFLNVPAPLDIACPARLPMKRKAYEARILEIGDLISIRAMQARLESCHYQQNRPFP